MYRLRNLPVIMGLLIFAPGFGIASDLQDMAADGTETAIANEGAPQDGTQMVPSAAGDRFSVSREGIITDSATDLDWYLGGDSNISWNQAVSWVENLSATGAGWRMPTRSELRTLYQEGTTPRHLDPVFTLTAPFIWSGDTLDESSAWCFYFDNGTEHLYYDRDYFYHERVAAVRSHR